MPFSLIATAAFGLEAVVSRELKALGYEAKVVQPGRLRFTGDWSAVSRANLWLRSANRVLIEVGTFRALDFGELFDQTAALPWEEWIPSDGEFPVLGKSVRSQLHHVPTCQKMVKKSIVERLRRQHGVTQLPETGPKCVVEVSVLNDDVSLTIDTSGHGLHRRGYRTLVGEAPLRETLAAAMIQLSFWSPARQLIDPFCGSGTLPIEAALIGQNVAPGLQRDFAAESWPQMPNSCWQEARTEARDQIRSDVDLDIIGSDINPQALKLAQQHARQAGMQSQIRWRERPFSDLQSSVAYGCVVTNPPYGQRIGEQDELQPLYQSMPRVLSQLQDWSYWILTPDEQLEETFRRSADRRRKLYNGRIRCTLYQFFGARPPKGHFPSTRPDANHE